MPNAFYRRRQLAAQVAKDSRDLERAEFLWDMDKICRQYEETFTKYYGYGVKVDYVKGWFVSGGRRWRRQEFEQKIKFLEAKIHVRDTVQVEE